MDSLGLDIVLSALLTSALIYVANLYVDDVDDDERSWGLWNYAGRATYAIFNMGIMVAPQERHKRTNITFCIARHL
jgi:hypothetical protein